MSITSNKKLPYLSSLPFASTVAGFNNRNRKEEIKLEHLVSKYIFWASNKINKKSSVMIPLDKFGKLSQNQVLKKLKDFDYKVEHFISSNFQDAFWKVSWAHKLD